MKPIGLIGGIGPESTVDYYRAMIGAYRQRQPDGSYPQIVITSVDANAMLGALMQNQLERVTDLLVTEVERLEANSFRARFARRRETAFWRSSRR